MKFDSNQAWKDATAAISANRDVVFAIAGVFFLLPSLAFGLLVTPPEQVPGMTPQQAMEVLRGFYADTLPWIVPTIVMQGIGSLALLVLLTDRSRPTVGEALRMGAMGLLPYVLAQMLVGLVVGVLGMTLVGMAVATGLKPLAVLLGGAVFAAGIYAMVRTSLVGPVIMVEGLRRPVAAIRRSWDLTRANSARIAVFFLLVFFAFALVMGVIGALVGIVAALLAGAEAAKVVDAVVSSAIGSVMTLYIVAMLAAVHRQLAGPSAEAVGRTFE